MLRCYFTMTESKVRVLIKEIISGFKKADDRNTIIEWLSIVHSLLNSKSTIQHPLLNRYADVPLLELRRLFIEHHYARFCSTILEKVSVEWMQHFEGNDFSTYVENLFLLGPASDTLLSLDHALQSTRQSFKLQKMIVLLELFFSKGRLTEVLWDQCRVLKASDTPRLTGKADLWEDLILTLISLPSKMANRLGTENSDHFLPQNYVPNLACSILECMQRTHDFLQNSHDCSLEFISRLMGKLCFTGYADLLLDVILPSLCTHVSKDFIWCRECERVVTGVPPLCTESLIVPILTKIPWYGLVEKFLGDCVLHNHKVHFLLCTKLLFHRFFSQVLLLQNLIGYLASSHTRRHLYIEVFCNLLRIWGDASSLRHIPAEQHLFLSRALMVCTSHLGKEERQHWKDEIIRLLLPGVQSHLGSSDPAVRTRGMLVAQALTRTIDPQGQQIEFEFTRTPEVDDLEKMLVVPMDPGLIVIEQHIKDVKLNTTQPESIPDGDSGPGTMLKVNSELDSDDDLEPYDMSNDKKISNLKIPKYIRDCMEGLLNQEDPDILEGSLITAEVLIRRRPDGLSELAQELVKILLHLTSNFGIVDFVKLRFQAMVALAVMCPQQVVPFLTGEFYQRNYNIRQRLDILEILAAAAQELSKPDTNVPDKNTLKENLDSELGAQPDSWRMVVQRRIDNKTRRFGKGRSKPEVTLTPNRFGPVAGEFFYPLMRFCDRREPAFDLLGDDSLVLHRLVFTLAIILNAAINTTAASQMGKTLLEFTWSLRLHKDVTVRQALLVATSMVFLVVPSTYLLIDLQVDVMETKVWLEEILDRDVNVECRKLAAQALTLLGSMVAKEMGQALPGT